MGAGRLNPGRLLPVHSQPGPSVIGAHGRPRTLRRGAPLRRRDDVRQPPGGARVRRHGAGLRDPGLGYLRLRARHLSGPAERLPLRRESGRRAFRCTGLQRPAVGEPGLGGRNRRGDSDHRVRMGGGDRGSDDHAAVPRDRRAAGLGDQLLPANQADLRRLQLGAAHPPVPRLQDVPGGKADVARRAGAGAQPVGQAVRERGPKRRAAHRRLDGEAGRRVRSEMGGLHPNSRSTSPL